MEELRFEWDSAKAAENHEKHGVSFDEAVSVFEDGTADYGRILITPRTKIGLSYSV